VVPREEGKAMTFGPLSEWEDGEGNEKRFHEHDHTGRGGKEWFSSASGYPRVIDVRPSGAKVELTDTGIRTSHDGITGISPETWEWAKKQTEPLRKYIEEHVIPVRRKGEHW
jgi:hypothetical protein